MNLSFSTGITKFALRDFLVFLNKDQVGKKSVYIYGAGAAGSITGYFNRKLKILGFIDDDYKLWGRTLKGIKIFHPIF